MAKDKICYQPRVLSLDMWVNPKDWSVSKEPMIHDTGNFRAYPFRTKGFKDGNLNVLGEMAFIGFEDFEAIKPKLGELVQVRDMRIVNKG